MPTPLHNHTYFSAYDGLSKPKQIADRVVDLGYSACACTDHDVVAGHIEFYKTMNDVGVKPLLGIETYQSPISRRENYKALKSKESGRRVDNFHLLLLAMNNKGLSNLWAMNTEAHTTGFYYNGRVDWELLEKYNEGIIVTSACALGMIQQALQNNPHLPDAEEILQRYLNIFGDRFYLELSTYPEDFQRLVNIDTVKLASTYGVPVTYANDAHYASPDQYELHEAVQSLSKKEKLKDRTEPHHVPGLYIMSEDEIRNNLDHLSSSTIDEAINNTDRIAELCTVELPKFKQHVPVFVPSGYKSSKNMLFDLVMKAFDEKVVKLGKDEDLYFERAKSELEVIFRANLVDYLLMVRDYCMWGDSQGIMRGPGRGSAGGSLICYLLGITDVDPIRFNLIFERFYNAGRETSLPDIDIDFAKAGRERIKEYIMQRYGAEYVSDIGTIIRLQPKSAILDVARVLSVPYKDAQTISKILDQGIKAGLQPTWDAIEEKLGEQLQPWKEQYPLLFEMATSLLETASDTKDDAVKSYGIHATGVLISDVPLGSNFPLRCATDSKTKEKKLVSQWDMRDAEKLGFMKADLCGLRNLDTLSEVNNILKDEGIEPIDYDSLQDMEFPDEMWELLDKGATTGIFQVEDEPLVKQIAKQMKPRSLEDLAVLVAMNRPGPLQSKDARGRSALERYMQGRHTGEIDFLNDTVAKVTSETHGIFLFQEQIINFMVEIGYSLMEADDVRSMMGKKKKEKLDQEYERYFPRACQFMSADHADEIWEQLKNFAEYGFNKSHAVEYAVILLWTLYAKWRHLRPFIVASIRTADKDKKSRYVREAQRLKMLVYAPIIGRAKAQASLYEDGIMLGYGDVMGIGIVPAHWMVANTYEGMTLSALADLLGTDEGKIIQGNGKKRVALTSAHLEAFTKLNLFPDAITDYGKSELLEVEEELLKVAISDNSAKILEDYKDLIEENCTPYSLINEPGEYAIAGIIRDITRSKTKTGKDYAKIKLTDDDGDELELFVWNKELKRLNFIFRHRTAGVFNVKRNNDDMMSLLDASILYPKEIGNTKYEQLLN